MSRSQKLKNKPCIDAWKTCIHVTGFGQMAVDVDMDCPAGKSIKGRRMCLKDNCNSACLHWEAKE